MVTWLRRMACWRRIKKWHEAGMRGRTPGAAKPAEFHRQGQIGHKAPPRGRKVPHWRMIRMAANGHESMLFEEIVEATTLIKGPAVTVRDGTLRNAGLDRSQPAVGGALRAAGRHAPSLPRSVDYFRHVPIMPSINRIGLTQPQGQSAGRLLLEAIHPAP